MAYYKIAGLVVEMESFGRTVKQAESYRCTAQTADIIIKSDWQALQKSQPHLSDEDCEYLCTGGSFYRQLLNFDGMMLHASAVVLDGKAYLFSAPCGTGKSTHTALWKQVFGNRAVILNDDKPALRLENGTWYAYGTPWSGKYDMSINMKAPVAGICFLHQARQNTIEPLNGPKAIFALLEQTARPPEAAARAKLMDLLDRLISLVPLWQMGCNISPEAALLSSKNMTQYKNPV
ncbi:MAG: hypothetical protein IJ422_07300 [Oscillospiraceae bacterium]|nr:hypothetical protein [Oscillospiraceae bacterium]